jgi:phospholipase/carboxylesterase
MREVSTQEQEEYVGLRFIHRAGVDPSAPLIVLVHGRAGAAEVMWAFDRLMPSGCAVVSFQAFLPDALGGFSWWDMASPDPLEPAILRARDKFMFALERYIELTNLRPRKTVALGFSQGSVLLSAAVLTDALHIDGLGVLAGFLYKGGDVSSLRTKPEVFIAHGSNDEVISVAKARRGVERLRSLGLSVEYVEEEIGHKVGIQGTRALKEWLVKVCA